MPDVNVLVALLDGLHVHHGIAKRWFDAASQSGWATCPVTISGALRVISRPKPIGVLAISDVRDLLSALIQANLQSHEFWLDSVDLLDDALFDLTKLQGYRQMTDFHLLAIAQRHQGTLVTLDGGLTSTLNAFRAPSNNMLRILTP